MYRKKPEDLKTPAPTETKLKDRWAIHDEHRSHIFTALQEKTCFQCKGDILPGEAFTKHVRWAGGVPKKQYPICTRCYPFIEEVDEEMKQWLEKVAADEEERRKNPHKRRYYGRKPINKKEKE